MADVGAGAPAGGDFAHFYEIVTSFAASAPGADGAIPVAPFLVAMDRFLRIFDALSARFYADIVKRDVAGNIMKLRDAAARCGAGSLQDVLRQELGDDAYARQIRAEAGPGRESGTVAALWMKRTLQFIHALLRHLVADRAVTLSDASQRSYTANLGLCHPWVTRKLFSAGLRFAPARAAFCENLGAGTDAERVDAAMRELVGAMDPLVAKLDEVYRERGLETCIV